MDRVVRRKQLLEVIGVSPTAQRPLERTGEFPARVKIGKRLLRWRLTEVEKWLETRERVLDRLQGSKGSGGDQMTGNQLGVDSKLPLCLGAERTKNKDGC